MHRKLTNLANEDRSHSARSTPSSQFRRVQGKQDTTRHELKLFIYGRSISKLAYAKDPMRSCGFCTDLPRRQNATLCCQRPCTAQRRPIERSLHGTQLTCGSATLAKGKTFGLPTLYHMKRTIILAGAFSIVAINGNSLVPRFTTLFSPPTCKQLPSA